MLFLKQGLFGKAFHRFALHAQEEFQHQGLVIVAIERRNHHVGAGCERFAVLHDNGFDGCNATLLGHHLVALNADNLNIAARVLRPGRERCHRIVQAVFCAIPVNCLQDQFANGMSSPHWIKHLRLNLDADVIPSFGARTTGLCSAGLQR